jgi:hypothetical protein
LKKRSKKLLLWWAAPSRSFDRRLKSQLQKFFASFFQKRRPFFLHFPSARLAGQVRPIAISPSWCSRWADV